MVNPHQKKMTRIPKNYKPTKKEKFMNAKMKEYFRQILVNWKDELLKESSQTLNNLQNDENSAKPDLTDRASDEIDRTFELRTRDRERKLINKIEAALNRIEEVPFRAKFVDDVDDFKGIEHIHKKNTYNKIILNISFHT